MVRSFIFAAAVFAGTAAWAEAPAQKIGLRGTGLAQTAVAAPAVVAVLPVAASAPQEQPGAAPRKVRVIPLYNLPEQAGAD